MQYLLMIYHDEALRAQMLEAHSGTIAQECGASAQSLVTSGHLRAGARLQPPAMAATVREQHGKRRITDGPFAETKEQLAGYLVVECQDLDEALAIAARFPSMRFGAALATVTTTASPRGSRTGPRRARTAGAVRGRTPAHVRCVAG
jgi:hypothetical protein